MMSSMLNPSAKATGRQRLLIAMVWMVQIGIAAYYSLLPSAQLGDMPGSDKLWHLTGYLILALPISFLWDEWGAIFVAGVSLALFGVGLEFAQKYVPGRSLEISDMLANSAGVVFGIMFARWLCKPLLARRWNLTVNPSNLP